MSQDRRKIKGFTLIELLITVGIMVSLIAVGAPLFKQSVARDQAVLGDANLTVSVLEQARNYAVHPESKDAESYSVALLTPVPMGGGDTLQIVRDGATSQVISQITLPNSKVQVLPPSPIKFNLFSGEYSGLPESLVLTLKSNPDKTRTVKVTAPGLIYVETPTAQ